jgi:transcriptional regulator with XRE-family HTH domain
MTSRALRRTKEPNASNLEGSAAAIGAQIRELRKVRGFTLQTVADGAGISVGYLSQIERNQANLPLSVLNKISDVLDVQINWFFQPEGNSSPGERDVVVRKSNRRRLTLTGQGIIEELLSPNLKGPIELLLTTIEPHADSGDYSHTGAEAGVVITGVLDLWIGGNHYRLEEGDSFSFKSSDVHRSANPGDVPTKIVWVVTPPH